MRSAHARGKSWASPLQRGLHPCMQWRRRGLCRAAQMGSWGDGAVSTQIKLWVGGPIAIHHAGTYRASQACSLERRTTAESWSIRLLCIIGHREQRIFTPECGSLLGTEIKRVLTTRGAAHLISWWSSAGLCDMPSLFYRLRFWVTD